MSPDIVQIDRELCARSFPQFVRRAWPSIIPDDLQWNWHLDAVGEHLQAVHTGQIRRLLINVPPGTSKSTLTGVMYPAWLWGPAGNPGHRYIGAAHEQGLAIRDNRMMRELINSEWYQARWPIALQGDQNEKLYFENTSRGFRQACAVASMTGRRGHTVTWDDPLSPEKAHTVTARNTAIRVLSETVPTRLNNPATSAIIVVMQRLHENDPSGHIIANDLGYEHLCIPMEFEPDRRRTTCIGWTECERAGGSMLTGFGKPVDVWKRWVAQLAAEGFRVEAVFVNRDYEPYAKERDAAVLAYFQDQNIAFHGRKDSVILEKDEVMKDDGKPYTVFTPYSKKWSIPAMPRRSQHRPFTAVDQRSSVGT